MAKNIEIIRNALGLTREKFCQEIGISKYNYKNYVEGKRIYPIRRAIELAKKYGFSLDWFYLNDGEVTNDSLAAVIQFRKNAKGGE